MTAQPAPRHAVYFTPAPQHPLWACGCAWLGREVDGVASSAGPAQPLVASPWRYGFHATLKAPMRLTPGSADADWLHALQGLAARHVPFAMPPLRVGVLSDFIALRPVDPLPPDHPLRRLADDCVLDLDRWRAPPTADELARQQKPRLDDRQRENVERFGYAFVLDDWRFHMTLSDSLVGVDAARIAALREAASSHFAHALAQPLHCDALSVFVEPAPGHPFELRHRIPLGGVGGASR